MAETRWIETDETEETEQQWEAGDQAASLVVWGRDQAIMSLEDNLKACEQLKEIKVRLKQVNEHFADAVQSTDKAHKDALGARNAITKPLKVAEKIIKAEIATFDADLQPAGITIKRSISFKVIDESLIPDEYKKMVVNDELIRAKLRFQPGVSIPGIEAYEMKGVTVRI